MKSSSVSGNITKQEGKMKKKNANYDHQFLLWFKIRIFYKEKFTTCQWGEKLPETD